MLCPVELRAPRRAQCSRELNRIESATVVRSPAAFQAVVAQLVEQLIRNQQVTGSSPVNGSKLKLIQAPANAGPFSYPKLRRRARGPMVDSRPRPPCPI